MSRPDLARELDRLQAGRNDAWRELALRLEGAQAAQNVAACTALASARPGLGASVLEVGGGVALFMGVGSPLTQALAMGLQGPLDAGDLDAIERHLGRDGGAPQFELCPLADPGLLRDLALRGYALQEFQLAWSRPLGVALDLDLPAGVEIRRATDTQALMRVILAGFLETAPGEVPEASLDLMAPTAAAGGQQLWGAWVEGELVGGGTLRVQAGVALLGGASVLPAYRGLGLQGALIRARLAEGLRAGCDLAACATAPGSASQRNMERHGFRVAYPKVVLLKA